MVLFCDMGSFLLVQVLHQLGRNILVPDLHHRLGLFLHLQILDQLKLCLRFHFNVLAAPTLRCPVQMISPLRSLFHLRGFWLWAHHSSLNLPSRCSTRCGLLLVNLLQWLEYLLGSYQLDLELLVLRVDVAGEGSWVNYLLSDRLGEGWVCSWASRFQDVEIILSSIYSAWDYIDTFVDLSGWNLLVAASRSVCLGQKSAD